MVYVELNGAVMYVKWCVLPN